jgi:hypothetical protein
MLISGTALVNKAHPMHKAAQASEGNFSGEVFKGAESWISSPLFSQGRSFSWTASGALNQIPEQGADVVSDPKAQSEGESSPAGEDSDDDEMFEFGEGICAEPSEPLMAQSEPLLHFRNEKMRLLEDIMEGKDSFLFLWDWIKERVEERQQPRNLRSSLRKSELMHRPQMEYLQRCLVGVVLQHLNLVEDAHEFVSTLSEKTSLASDLKVVIALSYFHSFPD